MEKTEMKKTITVKDFIEQYLIEHIKKIKGNYPYEAFLLISCGIEFLGKCLNNRNWQDTGQSKTDFCKAIEKIKPLQKYNSVKEDLYTSLRCGMCHAYKPKEKFFISDFKQEQLDKNKGDIVINIAEFYNAFSGACNALLEKEVTVNNLNDIFFEISEVGGTSTTGTTCP